MAHNDAFFAADAECIGYTKADVMGSESSWGDRWVPVSDDRYLFRRSESQRVRSGSRTHVLHKNCTRHGQDVGSR